MLSSSCNALYLEQRQQRTMMHCELAELVQEYRTADWLRQAEIVGQIHVLSIVVFSKAVSYAADQKSKDIAAFFELAANGMLDRDPLLKKAILDGKTRGEEEAARLMVLLRV